MQYKKTLDCLQRMAHAVERHCVNGQPWHIRDPSVSSWHIISDSDFNATSDSEVQRLLRGKHFVITDRPTVEMDYRKALSSIGPLRSTVVEIHGKLCFHEGLLFGCSPTVPDQLTGKIQKGLLSDVLSATEFGDKARAFDVQNVPQPLRGVVPNSFTSDAHALKVTSSLAGWKSGWNVPVGDMRWASCSTKNAFRRWAIAPHGFGMYMDVIHGAQWVLIARPRGQPVDFRHFSNIYMFFKENFDVDEANDKHLDIEAILLEPGTRL